ncbi:zinc finger CCCH domain-containing protein 3 isoform X2 [Cataglyphis hispanica]|uniref:zinc finger CCCH domain-containing protein 3 isoform X2 n=1 Tax=Cataglyphis hispanica TaxID=1086592 RepID=UPI00217F3571|nr:zinc finger CCCH domain-containing protein 3 isoform X2 [Cataglyphis hispanica]
MGVPSSAITETKKLNEISYLKGQIKEYRQNIHLNSQYKQKINTSNRTFEFVSSKIYPDIKDTVHNSFSNSEIVSEESIKNAHVKPQLLPTNVHVNPNFKPQNPTIHINPNIYAKPLIHINPKIMHNIASSNRNLQNNISTINVSTAKASMDNNTKPANIKRAIYVNPTMLNKLSKEKSAESKISVSKESVTTERPVCSRLKPIKNTDNQKISPRGKINNSSIVLLSRRKLVRATRSTKIMSRTFLVSQYKLSKAAELTRKKIDKTILQTKIKSLANNALQSTSKSNFSKLRINKSNNNSKVTKYKIDRTILKVKKTGLSEKRKVIGGAEKLVTIGGIVYKASQNKLVRKNSLLKRKRSFNGKNDKPSVVIYDKKQRFSKEILNCTLGTNTNSKARFTINMSLKTKYSISNKAKQRSIRILRNKMHKNNQPCLIFQRFGSCPNYENGKCVKRHDKNQVSLCKNFLQGKCFLNKCSLSHDVGPEKMPTCKYFLDGCCTRDDCPYLHVKVSSNTSICIDFLQGYCAKGTKCQRRHEYLCPEFNKSGNCSKGECCPYPHKSHFSDSEKSTKYSSKMRTVQKTTLTTKNDSEILNTENRLRYYEINNSFTEHLEKKKKTPIIDRTKQVKINEMKESLVKESEDILDETACHSNNKKKRVSTGSYIPIDIF